MDIILVLQIVLTAAAASITKEIYDTSKHCEPMRQFFAEVIMSTMTGTIVGFILQKYSSDNTMFLLGIVALASTRGPQSLDLLLKVISKLTNIELNDLIKSDGNNETETSNKEDKK